jgi:hypothetical protein
LLKVSLDPTFARWAARQNARTSLVNVEVLT